MERKKLTHQLDSPFSTVQWSVFYPGVMLLDEHAGSPARRPQITQDDQDTILELLSKYALPIFSTEERGYKDNAC